MTLGANEWEQQSPRQMLAFSPRAPEKTNTPNENKTLILLAGQKINQHGRAEARRCGPPPSQGRPEKPV